MRGSKGWSFDVCRAKINVLQILHTHAPNAKTMNTPTIEMCAEWKLTVLKMDTINIESSLTTAQQMAAIPRRN